MTAPERVLVVDDGATNRRILACSLTKAGYETREAVDGLEALGAALDWRPDVVLLDVDMPGCDGFEVCERLKADPATASTPVIFLTALTAATDIERAFAVGGSDYVTKPVHLGELKARVAVHLRLRRAELELKQANAELLQAQKLESIGRLAAGIAHEINTPTQFIGDNLRFAADAFADLVPVLERVRELAGEERSGDGVESRSEALEALRAALVAADYEYLRTEVPLALAQAQEGVDRVAGIVGAMKEFAHPAGEGMSLADLNRAVESTVTVARNEWKLVADIETDLEPDLPLVACLPGEVNQVLLNLLVNAAHAIADALGDGDAKGLVRIRTRRDGDRVEIRVSDTGGGIPEAVRDKIFDPFFTTKEVGRGTGQGLAIARSVVVVKHGGTLHFETETGRGTTFVVRLPIEQQAADRAA